MLHHPSLGSRVPGGGHIFEDPENVDGKGGPETAVLIRREKDTLAEYPNYEGRNLTTTIGKEAKQFHLFVLSICPGPAQVHLAPTFPAPSQCYSCFISSIAATDSGKLVG